MRYLDVSDFVGALETTGLLKGKIVAVNKDNGSVDVDVEGFDVIIRGIPVTPVYCSSVCNSIVFVMPRVGDIVWLGRCQGEFVILGYVVVRNPVDMSASEIDKTIVRKFKDEADMENNFGATVYDMKEGDIGFFLHEGDRMLEFMMLAGGRIMLGFGAGAVIYDQDEIMERKFINKYRSFDANGGVIEWGLPEVKTVGGIKVTKYKEFVYKVKSGDGSVVFQLGYIDDGITGESEKGRFGGNLRFRLKVGNYEINMDESGNTYATVNNVRVEMENEDVVIRSMKKESIGSNCEVDITGDKELKVGGNESVEIAGNKELKVGGNESVEIAGNKELKAGGEIELTAGGTCRITSGGDMIIEGGNVKISGGNITIAGGNITIAGGNLTVTGQLSVNGGLALVMASLLPLLESHRHVFYGIGMVGEPIGLSGLMVHATKTLTAS
jgi:hypothetical protein